MDIPLNAEVVNQQLAAGGRTLDNALSPGMRIEYWYNEELGWLEAQVRLPPTPPIPLCFCLSLYFLLSAFVSWPVCMCLHIRRNRQQIIMQSLLCCLMSCLKHGLYAASHALSLTPPCLIYLSIHSPARPFFISSILQLLSCQRLAGEVLWWKVKFLSDGTTENLKLNVDTKARWRILRSSE